MPLNVSEQELFDLSDTTKRLRWILSGITTGTTVELTPPASSGTVVVGGSSAISLVIENRTSDPGSPAVGQIWLRTDL